MSRITALILCLCISACLISCSNEALPENTETTLKTQPAAKTVKLGSGKLSLYFSVSDSLNPYEAVTRGNRDLTSLLFDGLTKLDENMNTVMKLADRIAIEDGRIIITLKHAEFSDGSVVTAEDVTYSMDLAKKSKNNFYKNRLDNIKSYAAASASVVELVLHHPDVNIAANLDFPIVKSYSVNRENDDGKPLPPIGAGRYVYYDNSGVYLLKGNKHYHGSVPENTVSLVNTPDSQALEYNIKAGEVDIYYSGINVGGLPAMGGKYSTVVLPNFVYIGLNSKTEPMKNANMRKAVSCIIDRAEICSQSYYSYALPATGTYPQSSRIIAENTADIFEKTKNLEKAVEHLASCGYNNTDKEGYYTDGVKRASLSLLYNENNDYQSSAAQLIAKQLKIGGVETMLEPASADSYKRRVAKGEYTAYLGEIKLSNSLDLTVLFDKKFNVTGKSEDSADVAGAYADYMKSVTGVESFIHTFGESPVFIPVAYRLGAVSSSAKVTPSAQATADDAYYNIERISVKKIKPTESTK